MEIIIVSFTAFGAAILTFFSGFGLGTILTPVFVLFFPVELAIALTGVVHFFNNIFKLLLVGRQVNKDVLLHFGVPAIFAAMLGAWLLLNLTDFKPLFVYQLWGNNVEIYPAKFLVSILLLIFATIELVPTFNKWQFDKKLLSIGGFLSGFFGGLSGNQGALRSAFLLKAGLSKEMFIGTTVVISTLVDFTRLSIYATRFLQNDLISNLDLVFFAVFSGIIGSYIGNKLLKKVTLHFIQLVVAIMLMIISVLMLLGFL